MREAILERTHYGVRVYAHVLRQYYQDEVVLLLSDNTCKPAKNPFNGDKKTLHVSIVDGLARHFDAELERCKGDAFDFAAMHYKVEGMELLERLNEVLDLGIGKEVRYCNSAEGDRLATCNEPRSTTNCQLSMGKREGSISNRQMATSTEQQSVSNEQLADDGGKNENRENRRESGKHQAEISSISSFSQFPQKAKSEEIDQTVMIDKYQAKENYQLATINKQLGKGDRDARMKGSVERGKSKSGELITVLPKFSFFKKPVRNTLPSGTISLVDVYKKIKGISYRKQTNVLRTMQNEKEARVFKAEQFDYVTFSGMFTKRENKALVQHSGLFAVDLDHIEDVEGLKQRFLQDPFFETILLFVSPSGHGLKWIIPIDLNKATHQEYAKALSNYLLHTYHQKMDASGKDVARACFLPHDPNIYINPKYL